MANDGHVDVATAGEAVRTPTIPAGLQGVNAPKLHLKTQPVKNAGLFVMPWCRLGGSRTAFNSHDIFMVAIGAVGIPLP